MIEAPEQRGCFTQAGVFMQSKKLFPLGLVFLFLYLLFTAAIPVMLSASEEIAFLPTWKLLNTQEKQQFVSGYTKGWKDAAQVIDIAISYVEQNPEKAVEGLKSLREVYELGDIRPDTLVQEIDAFYSDPENSKANLSKAVTAAKNRRRL